jgi:hypothetical protein
MKFHQLFPSDYEMFETLIKSVTFETFPNGRQSTILVKTLNGLIPLVRSTTNYSHPYQTFSPYHSELANEIASFIANNQNVSPISFNNTMIELYANQYKSMKYHTDQSLDLENESWICLFSCYSDPTSKFTKRILRIKNKISGVEKDITLENNSIVFFNTETNNNHFEFKR